MVAEAHSGAWGPRATKVWVRLGKALSILSGESAALEALQVRQNLGLSLHRETARAILRRSPSYITTADREAANTLLSTNYNGKDYGISIFSTDFGFLF